MCGCGRGPPRGELRLHPAPPWPLAVLREQPGHLVVGGMETQLPQGHGCCGGVPFCSPPWTSGPESRRAISGSSSPSLAPGMRHLSGSLPSVVFLSPCRDSSAGKQASTPRSCDLSLIPSLGWVQAALVFLWGRVCSPGLKRLSCRARAVPGKPGPWGASCLLCRHLFGSRSWLWAAGGCAAHSSSFWEAGGDSQERTSQETADPAQPI